MTNKLFSALGSLCFSLVAFASIPACAVADGEGDEDMMETAGTTGGKLDETKLDRVEESEQPTPTDNDHRRMDSGAIATGLQVDSDAKFDERRPATDGVEVASDDTAEPSDATIDGSIDLADVLESLRQRNVR
jgi:hypothetical protein